jgi:hypothetical protein
MIYNAQNPMTEPSGAYRTQLVNRLLSEGDGRDLDEVNEMIKLTHEMYLIRMKNDVPQILAFKYTYGLFLGEGE